MPIGGNADTFNITGAKLKVSGGVQVSGSIAYTDDATGFGGVTAQIDNDNTLNITAGKTSGVAKIERGTTANITGITHTNVSNNTTIHIALKNTSSNEGDFVTIGTFANDSTVKVNYTDEYVIGPGETGMLTLRKVNGVLSLFIREMFSSTATDFDTANKPFYIKDGVDYKYPLYKNTGANLVTETIGGVTYYRPSSELKIKTRPPKGLPELIVTPTGNLAIGNSGTGTTVNYDVWGVPASFDFGSIYKGTTKKAIFLLENGEASGSFTESGASSGDAYSLYVERTDTSTSDTVSFGGFVGTIAFHYGAFSVSDYSGAYSTVEAAATAGFVYSDTDTTISYTWGTLNSVDTSTSGQTGYSWTPPSEIEGADVLMVAGGGGGGGTDAGGGGAGGLLHYTNQTISSGQKTIVVGGGGEGGLGWSNTPGYGAKGKDTTFTYLNPAFGGGGGGNNDGNGGETITNRNGGSGGGADGVMSPSIRGNGTSGQGNNGGTSNTGNPYSGGGGGGAGGVGANGTSSYGGSGGIGLDKSSVFGTMYGDSGWFASGGGGGSRSSGSGTPGTASQGGGTAGTASSTAATDAQKHTGGGGGGAGYHTGSNSRLGGDGGSGIVLIKSSGTDKKIPKVTGASFDSTNVTFTVQDASNITNIKYTINGGSVAETPVGTLAVAHSLASAESITVVAWAVDTNGNQLSVKKTVTGTIP